MHYVVDFFRLFEIDEKYFQFLLVNNHLTILLQTHLFIIFKAKSEMSNSSSLVLFCNICFSNSKVTQIFQLKLLFLFFQILLHFSLNVSALAMNNISFSL